MKKCIYLTEGECEVKLINALKEKPSLVIPGKVKKFNVIQNEIPRSIMMFNIVCRCHTQGSSKTREDDCLDRFTDNYSDTQGRASCKA